VIRKTGCSKALLLNFDVSFTISIRSRRAAQNPVLPRAGARPVRTLKTSFTAHRLLCSGKTDGAHHATDDRFACDHAADGRRRPGAQRFAVGSAGRSAHPCLNQPISTLYIGNPSVADVTMIDKRHAFVWKILRRHNIVALDARDRGQQSAGGRVRLRQLRHHRATRHRADDYSCAARAATSPQPGDGKDPFETTWIRSPSISSWSPRWRPARRSSAAPNASAIEHLHSQALGHVLIDDP